MFEFLCVWTRAIVSFFFCFDFGVEQICTKKWYCHRICSIAEFDLIAQNYLTVNQAGSIDVWALKFVFLLIEIDGWRGNGSDFCLQHVLLNFPQQISDVSATSGSSPKLVVELFVFLSLLQSRTECHLPAVSTETMTKKLATMSVRSIWLVEVGAGTKR